MYSKVKILGHPLHPILVSFPVVFYTVAFLGFLGFQFNGDPFWYKTALSANYAGIGTALLAAVPGFLDWYLGIPKRSPAKQVGFTHAAYNISALLLFSLNATRLWGSSDNPPPSVMYPIFLTGLGFLLTLAAGYYGYALIGTYKVGVDLSPEQERLEAENEMERQRAA